MKFIDLFAGIGGFHLGLKDHECVYANEWDKYANKIYIKHFGECDTRDITTVNSGEIPEHELLCGGFPCQSFSIAGKRRGFDDTRGTLFFEIARILREKNPRLCLLENVKGLLSHDNGRTFKTIITTLTELGYDVQWQVLNSKNFGVPQNRERVFIIGNLRGTPRPKVFPITGIDSQDSLQGKEICSTLKSRYPGDWNGNYIKVGTLRTHKDGNGFREMKSNIAPKFPARAREDGSGQPVIRYPLRFLKRNQKNITGDYSFTIDGSNTGGIKQGMRIRRLTPIECERLQGFPDNWTEGISDTQRYKCLGNAVTVNVIKYLSNYL